jgi:branched-chain amino acid transport system substrate-binding protein
MLARLRSHRPFSPAVLRRYLPIVPIGATVLALAACGSDNDSSTAPETAKSTVATKSNPATGSPVVLGAFTTTHQPEFTDGVKAAVNYLNREAGGLLGHRIKLHACRSDGSPQQGIKCANELVRAGSIGVIFGEDHTADSAFPVYERAGVPVITQRVLTNQLLVNPVAVALAPGIPATLAAMGQYIRDQLKGDTAVTIATAGLPQKLLDQLVTAPLQASGVDNSWVFFNGESPNFASTFAAVAKKNPDVAIVDIDDNSQCIPAMNAMRSLGASFKVFQIVCSDASVLEAAGELANGELFYGPLDSITGVDSPDARLFKHIIETYSSSKSTGFVASTGASSVMTLARVLKKQGGDSVDSKAVLGAFRDSKGTNIFMGPPLTCGISKAFPRLCTLATRFFTVEGGRKKVLTGYLSAPQGLPGD